MVIQVAEFFQNLSSFGDGRTNEILKTDFKETSPSGRYHARSPPTRTTEFLVKVMKAVILNKLHVKPKQCDNSGPPSYEEKDLNMRHKLKTKELKKKTDSRNKDTFSSDIKTFLMNIQQRPDGNPPKRSNTSRTSRIYLEMRTSFTENTESNCN